MKFDYSSPFRTDVWEGDSPDTVLMVMLQHRESYHMDKGLSDRASQELIESKVCEFFEMDRELMLSRTRKAEVKTPRQILQTLLRTHTVYSLSTIGELTSLEGNKPYNHATVLNSIGVVCDMIETEPSMFRTVNDIRSMCGFSVIQDKNELSDIYRKSVYRNNNYKV